MRARRSPLRIDPTAACGSRSRNAWPDSRGANRARSCIVCCHVRAARDGVQRPDRHRVLVRRASRARGGKAGPHADGWGLALYDGRVARMFLEPDAAANSPLATFVREHPIKTLLAIAHVRRKTRGGDRPREHAPVRARAVGAPLRVRAQRHGEERAARSSSAASSRSARPTASTRSARCSARSSTSSRTTRARRPTTPPRSRRYAGKIGKGGTFNMLLGDGQPAVRALLDEAALHRAQGAVQAGDARRRGRHASTSPRSRRRTIASRSSRRCR